MQRLKKKIEGSKELIEEFEVEGKSLFQLLNDLDFLDGIEEEGVVEKQKEILEAVKNKADGYKYIHDRYEAEAARLQKMIEEFQARKKAVVNGHERIKKIAHYILEEEYRKHNTSKLVGNIYTMRRQKIANKIDTLRPPTALDAVKNRKYIRTKYEWSKTKIKEGWGKDKNIEEFATSKEAWSLRFDARKDV